MASMRVILRGKRKSPLTGIFTFINFHAASIESSARVVDFVRAINRTCEQYNLVAAATVYRTNAL